MEDGRFRMHSEHNADLNERLINSKDINSHPQLYRRPFGTKLGPFYWHWIRKLPNTR